jgi:hypothetical protein
MSGAPTDPFAVVDPRAGERRRAVALGVSAAVVALAVIAAVLLLRRDDLEPRSLIAVDVTLTLGADDRKELLRDDVTASYAERGEPVAVYTFGGDGSEARQRLDFQTRSECEHRTCDLDWEAEAEQVLDIAAAAETEEVSGSGVLEGLCSLPTQPGDTVYLASDLSQRTPSLDIVIDLKLSDDDTIQEALERARTAGLVCEELEGVHLVVVGFGSDGRTGTELDATERFWEELARDASVASIEIRRF